jgi:DNA polymerase-1
LFEDLNLPSERKGTSGQRSTDSEVLDQLSKLHPIPHLILKYRELAKLISTYLEPLPLAINPKTGRVHTTFSQTIASTGRLASSDPNLQNIPTSSDFDIHVRKAFIAPEGALLLSADYSQIELRILAQVTQDPGLCSAFLQHKDIHTQTAAQLFEKPEAEITREERGFGKRINFSIMYGMTPYGLSKDLDITPVQAKKYIESYFRQYPRVHVWMTCEIQRATTVGYTQTLWGRRRYLSGLKEKNKHLYEAACRAAVNTPIQGTAADLIKVAMLTIDKQLTKQQLKTKMLLQIHDELIFEVVKNELNQVKQLVKEAMEQVVSWSIPLEVSLREGITWDDITK